jgi:hypothetical protein
VIGRLTGASVARGIEPVAGDQGSQIGKLRSDPPGQVDDAAIDGNAVARPAAREIT